MALAGLTASPHCRAQTGARSCFRSGLVAGCPALGTFTVTDRSSRRNNESRDLVASVLEGSAAVAASWPSWLLVFRAQICALKRSRFPDQNRGTWSPGFQVANLRFERSPVSRGGNFTPTGETRLPLDPVDGVGATIAGPLPALCWCYIVTLAGVLIVVLLHRLPKHRQRFGIFLYHGFNLLWIFAPAANRFSPTPAVLADSLRVSIADPSGNFAERVLFPPSLLPAFSCCSRANGRSTSSRFLASARGTWSLRSKCKFAL